MPNAEIGEAAAGNSNAPYQAADSLPTTKEELPPPYPGPPPTSAFTGMSTPFSAAGGYYQDNPAYPPPKDPPYPPPDGMDPAYPPPIFPGAINQYP